MPKPPVKGQRVKPIVKNSGKKLQVTAKVKDAIHQMIHNGMTRSQAAEAVGMLDNSLYKALCKPDVLEYKNRVLREFRESLAEKSLVRMDNLADYADKDSVKFQSNKFLIEQDQRFTPTTKQILEGQITHKVTPGYVIDLSEDSEQVLDSQLPVIDIDE